MLRSKRKCYFCRKGDNLILVKLSRVFMCDFRLRCVSIEFKPNILANIEVQQVRFHPDLSQGTHLVVLTSDNFLRVYNLLESSSEKTNSQPELICQWSVGQQPMNRRTLKGSQVPFLVGLGETAVDFDFGLPIMVSNKN